MHGHQKIIEMRLAGRKPDFIFINDFPCDTNWNIFKEYATVCVYGDDPARLDLRYLVGLKASICSPDESRAMKLFERAKAAGVKVVASGHVKKSEDGWVGFHG